MTPQEIFDKVADHLFAQKAVSMNGINGCVYRGPNGLMCAVGCLIPDEMYDPGMDIPEKATGISTILDKYEFPDFFKKNLPLLSDLQAIHDGGIPYKDDKLLLFWDKQFENHAMHYNLIYKSRLS